MIWFDAWATAFGVASIAFACTIYYTAKAWFAYRGSGWLRLLKAGNREPCRRLICAPQAATTEG